MANAELCAADYDHLFKVLLIGDSGVGKSSILLRFTDDAFSEAQLATIGIDFKIKMMQIGNKRIKLAVWDTAGQERFRTLTTSFYRGAQGIILVYDCSSMSSFQNVKGWLEEIRRFSTNTEAVKMLVANKIDKEVHEVSTEEGQQFALENSTLFIEVSAKTKEGIEDAFEEVVMKMVDQAKEANTGVLGVQLGAQESNAMSNLWGLCCPTR